MQHVSSLFLENLCSSFIFFIYFVSVSTFQVFLGLKNGSYAFQVVPVFVRIVAVYLMQGKVDETDVDEW